jgi:3-dehydroquinate synthase class II
MRHHVRAIEIERKVERSLLDSTHSTTPYQLHTLHSIERYGTQISVSELDKTGEGVVVYYFKSISRHFF